jgi:hypothetical protein
VSAATLFDPVVVHCVFCSHAVESFAGDPVALHDEMELHYESAHRSEINRAVGRVLVRTVTIGAEWGES